MLVRITCIIVKSRSSRETFTVYFDVPSLTWIICLRFSGKYIRIINFKLCFCSFYLSALKYSCISLVHFNPCAILPPFRVDHHVWQRYSKLSYKRRGRMSYIIPIYSTLDYYFLLICEVLDLSMYIWRRYLQFKVGFRKGTRLLWSWRSSNHCLLLTLLDLRSSKNAEWYGHAAVDWELSVPC